VLLSVYFFRIGNKIIFGNLFQLERIYNIPIITKKISILDKNIPATKKNLIYLNKNIPAIDKNFYTG